MRKGVRGRRWTAWVGDWGVLVATLLLVLIGLVMVYSASFDLTYRYDLPSTYYLGRQALWALVGLGVMVGMMRLDYRLWTRWAVWAMGGVLVLLIVVAAMGGEQFGARRWLLAGGSVQPSELAKVVVVIYIGAWLASKGERIRELSYGLIPFSILVGVVAGLILWQKDLSTALQIVLVAGVMFFVAGADVFQLSLVGVFGGATFGVLVYKEGYRWDRVVSFLFPARDPEGVGFQPRQALGALANGGMTGSGLGAGTQKAVLPAPHTDTIFAVLGEELGLLGCLVVLGLFVWLGYRGIRIARESPDAFGTLVAVGATFSLVFQGVLNMAIVAGVLPYAGVPLPFISYGGSAMVGSMALVGLLLSVARGRWLGRRRSRGADLRLGRGDWRARVSGFGGY